MRNSLAFLLAGILSSAFAIAQTQAKPKPGKAQPNTYGPGCALCGKNEKGKGAEKSQPAPKSAGQQEQKR